MKKKIREKINDFIESTLDAVLALLSLVMDAVFWIGWAYTTKLSGDLVNSLDISEIEAWPYKIAQWCGCGVLAIFVLFRTLKDVISLFDSFIEYLKARHKGTP